MLDITEYGAQAHNLTPARHHAVWLQAVAETISAQSEKRKLLIIAPPGHAKSTWISLVFPPWYLATHPDHSVLFFTSSDTMARQFGTTVRLTLESNEQHQTAFPQGEGRPDKARGWSTDGLYLAGAPAGSKDPSYRALGYGASVIGGRAHGIILDDPLTQEQAQSAVEQVKARQYHDMTVDSRLHPDGWEIAIMTRWHESDLASHLMAKPDWRTVAMPALGYWSEDAALWPERFPREWLLAKQQDIGGPLFNCLYQGDPSSLGGSVFKEAAWFRPFPPNFSTSGLRIVQYWDLAYSEKTSADYTCGLTLGIDAAKQLYVLNVIRKRMSPQQVEDAMVEAIHLWRPCVVGVEEAAYKQLATRDLVRRVNAQALAGVLSVKVSTDKVTRALLPAARAEAGLLYCDRSAPWAEAFIAECLGFPLAAHDDQVDALSGAMQLAIEKLPAPRPAQRQVYTLSPAKPQSAWPFGGR